jgi:hypothetical protein
MSETEPTTEPVPAPGPDTEPDTDPDFEPVTEPDAEPDVAPVPAPDTEPESQALMEEIGKKLDGVQRYVARKMSEILGEHANDFEVCDLCSYWNTPGWRHTGQLPAELIDQLLHVLGQRSPTDLREDRYSEACDRCNGEGVVLTGSKVPGQDRLSCVDCNGMGWVPVGTERTGRVLSLANGPTAQALGEASADVAMQPAPPTDTPEIRSLRDQGYVVIPPIAVPS